MPAPVSDNYAALQADVEELWDRAVSEPTRRVYNSGFRIFTRFMAMKDSRWEPQQLQAITEDCLLQFAAHCHYKLQICHSTIKSYMCGIRFHCFKRGYSTLWAATGLVRLEAILRAIKRSQVPVPVKRQPITAEVLGRICAVLDKGVLCAYSNMLMKAVCTMAFFAFLRCGEFTCDKFDPNVNLTRGSVSFINKGNSYLLTLKASKTDPFRKGVTLSVSRVNKAFCPVKALDRYLGASRKWGSQEKQPLFITVEGLPLSRSYFLRHLRIVLGAAGLDKEQFSGHSFRIGAATSASRAGIPDHLIQTLGRWSSDCYVRYIRVPLESIARAQCTLAEVS